MKTAGQLIGGGLPLTFRHSKARGATERWFDYRTNDRFIRVVFDDDVQLYAFDKYGCLFWQARFDRGAPAAVALAAIKAACE